MILQEMLQDEREAGRAEGLAEGRADTVLFFLEHKLGEAPEKVKEKILSETDRDVLNRYLELATNVKFTEEFARQILK